MMLGMASVPLAALLQEPWVDRYAAVFAVMREAGTEDEHKRQVRLYQSGGGRSSLIDGCIDRPFSPFSLLSLTLSFPISFLVAYLSPVHIYLLYFS